MNAQPLFSPFFFTLLWIPHPNFPPSFSLPFFFFCHSHALSLALNPALFSSFQSSAFSTVVPSPGLLLLSTILQLRFDLRITASFLTRSRKSPCFFFFCLWIQRMCKNTFSTTDMESVLAWWCPCKPDLNKLTLYTEFTALLNQHFNLWLYIFSLDIVNPVVLALDCITITQEHFMVTTNMYWVLSELSLWTCLSTFIIVARSIWTREFACT